MKFSVVIPLYNKEKYIRNTLKSVLDQTVHNFEIIVVDDGSTDGSLQAANSIANEKIKVISQKNAGVAVARNVGVENAKADYIAFLDADDKWQPNYLENIEKLIDEFPESDI